MTALAAGAVWSLAAQWSRGAPDWYGLNSELASWFAIPSAIAVALVLRLHRIGGTVTAVFCAALFTAIAIAYANYLMAAARIARLLGLDLFPSFTDIGPEMVVALIRTTAGYADCGFWLFAVLVASALVARSPTRRLATARSDRPR